MSNTRVLGERIDSVDKPNEKKDPSPSSSKRSSQRNQQSGTQHQAKSRSGSGKNRTSTARVIELTTQASRSDSQPTKRRSVKLNVSEPNPFETYRTERKSQFKQQLDNINDHLHAVNCLLDAETKLTYLRIVRQIGTKIDENKSSDIQAQIDLLKTAIQIDEKPKVVTEEPEKQNPAISRESQMTTKKPSFFRRLCCCASVIEDADPTPSVKRRA